jgi:hypothetical protein
MRKQFIVLAVLAIMVLGGVFAAQADTILDAYWGGTVVGASPTAYGDQISGSLHEFGVDQATVGVSGGMVSVKLTGNYFPSYLGNIGLAGSYGPGDLYISTSGWNPSTGPAPYSTDTFNSGEGWNLVVSQSGKVYSLDYGTITYSSASGGIYRADQAWTGGNGTFLADATVTLDASGMEFLFPLSVLGGSQDIGLHWNMKCANDVFEGAASVPIPPSAFLLGTGLLGLVGLGWRRKKSDRQLA